MELFVVCDDLASRTPLTVALLSLGGRPLTSNCWLVAGERDDVWTATRRTARSRALVIASDHWRQQH